MYALRLLAGAAAVALLYAGRSILVPVAFSATLAVLLVPVVRRLRRWHLPAALAAALAVASTLAVVACIGLVLEPPLRTAAEAAPRGIQAARGRIEKLRAPLAQLGRKLEGQPTTTITAPAARAAPGAASVPAPAPTRAAPGASTPAASTPADSTPAAEMSTRVRSAFVRAFGATAGFIGECVEVLLLTILLLAPGDRWAEKLPSIVPSPAARKTVTAAAGEIRGVVTRYVVATILINISEGVLVALAMWALGMPAPLLLGVLTALLELIPYLGGFVMVGLLLVLGLASGGSLVHALLPPALYLVVTTLQNDVVSPVAYGRQLQLNSVVILLATMLAFLLWGIGGAVLAVPIAATIRIVATHVRALAPLAAMLEP